MLLQIMQNFKIYLFPVTVIVIGLLLVLVSFVLRGAMINDWLRFFGFVLVLIGALQNMRTYANKRKLL